MTFFGINALRMAERTDLAGLKEIEWLDLFGVRFSSIERFEALATDNESNRGKNHGRRAIVACPFVNNDCSKYFPELLAPCRGVYRNRLEGSFRF
jgi:hypothetical protein